MIRNPTLVFLFCCFLLVGQWLMSDAWNGVVYIYVGEDRAPAAVKNINDYYPVSNKFLKLSSQEQLFGNLRYMSRENEMGVSIGNILMPDPQSGHRFACSAQNRPGIFDRVELSFVGVGVSDDGNIPKMIVDSSCAAEDELEAVAPIWIPMADIYQAEPKTQELHFPEFGQTSVHFQNLSSTWPEHWALVKVRLYQSRAGTSGLLLEPKRARSGELTFDWRSAK